MSTHEPVATESDDGELRELVRRYRMVWGSHPELAVRDRALVPIGFDVELSATYDHPAHPPMPGCPECAPVLEALRRVAYAALPRGEHASWYEVHVSNAMGFDPRHGRRPELTATIAIMHRGDVSGGPPDDCQRACLDETRARLVALGAQEGRWAEPSTPSSAK
jgi:hypothetical protein